MKRGITNKTILEILDRYRTLWSLGHLSALAGWDLNTYMPKKGGEARSEAAGKVSVLSQKIFLDPDFVKLIEKADKENLNETERAIIRLLKRDLKHYRKLPPEFIEEFSKLTSKSFLIWKEAKETSNFSLFEPYLERIVEMSRKKAKYLGYKEHPYDALLDEYEEGLTTKQVGEYFRELKPKIESLLDYIKNSKNYLKNHPLEKESYDIIKMKELNMKILNTVYGKMDDLRLDISTHPFTVSLGKGDTRITTRYLGRDFGGSYSSTIHEFGHALYELQLADNIYYTPLTPASLVLHESQSRFWENVLGRSKEFIHLFHKDILQLNKDMKRYSVDDIHRYLNMVRPSPVRTESDEVTYHLHIIIRFEIEKGLIEGTIKVKDLPKVWGDKYEEYLGIRPKNDREGVLQDSHWSGGNIGYFPTYSMGTASSILWKNALEKKKGEVSSLVKNKDFTSIKKWLKENIHQFGSTYVFNDLVMKVTGKQFSPEPLMNYLEEKYKKIY